MGEKARVLVAYGDPDWAEHLTENLKKTGLTVVGTVTNHTKLLEQIRSLDPNCLVINTLWDSMGYPHLEYTLAIIGGLALILETHLEFPELKIFVYTASPREDLLAPLRQRITAVIDASQVSHMELAEKIKESFN